MTDLKELEKFEADLKKLIEDRSKPFNYNTPQTRIRSDPPKQNVNLQALISDLDTDATYMVVPEHGYGTDDTFMVVPEHGFNQCSTLMRVPEHGKPIFTTRMAIKEHGQPYKNK